MVRLPARSSGVRSQRDDRSDACFAAASIDVLVNGGVFQKAETGGASSCLCRFVLRAHQVRGLDAGSRGTATNHAAAFEDFPNFVLAEATA